MSDLWCDECGNPVKVYGLRSACYAHVGVSKHGVGHQAKVGGSFFPPDDRDAKLAEAEATVARLESEKRRLVEGMRGIVATADDLSFQLHIRGFGCLTDLPQENIRAAQALLAEIDGKGAGK